MIRALAMVVGAGLLQAASLAWPFAGLEPFVKTGWPSGSLQLLAMGLLAWQLSRTHSPLKAGLLAWAFATAWLTGTFWWLFISMHRYGGLTAPLAGVAVLALAAALALYYALALGWLARCGLWGWRWALAFASVWTLAELMRGQWLTGFPWGAAGYAHTDSLLAAWAPWVGVYGIGAVAALLAAAVVADARKTLVGTLVATVAVVALDHLPQGQWGEPAGSLQVTLLQGNIAQNEKFDRQRGVEDALQWYAIGLHAAPRGLVVAPETAIPLLPRELPAGYIDALAMDVGPGRALLTGIPLGSLEEGYSNAALGLTRSTERGALKTYRYDKHHLVPFGEFIPPLFRWFTDMMNIPLGDFRRGDLRQPPFSVLGQRLAPNICYEDLFGEELARRFVPGDEAPTMMANLSNIGWFDDSTALDQHLHISRMRTLEFQRPMLRSTNTGTSALISHEGKVLLALPKLQQSRQTGTLQGRKGAVTPYALWAGSFGLWPLWGLSLLTLAIVVMLHRRLGRSDDVYGK